MQRTTKKLLMLPVLALTFGMVACESSLKAPALEAPSAPASRLLGGRIGGDTIVIDRDSLEFEFEAMGAFPPPPPPKYELGWP